MLKLYSLQEPSGKFDATLTAAAGAPFRGGENLEALK
jgi:hypothetical protein